MKKRSGYSSKLWLVILIVLTGIMIVLSLVSSKAQGPVRVVTGYTVTPMQKGINRFGVWTRDIARHFDTMQELKKENKKLNGKIDRLTTERTNLLQQEAELKRLRELYKLDQDYSDYEKVGAHVIAGSGSNWFSTVTIDKGSRDGITKDMNVIAGSGLVGIVTEVGDRWATVRSIIDDESIVSAMMLSTGDNCFVTGDLKLMNSGKIRFDRLANNKSVIKPGEHVVTSAISSRYVQGILIGYVDSVKVDSNDLTRSGYIVPAVDFQHLHEVLVIKKTKADLVGKKEGK